VGCAVAVELAKAGCAVTLLERDGVASHASRHNAGKLNPLYATPDALLPLALEAFAAHAALRAELAAMGCGDFGLQPVTRLFVRGDSDGDELDHLHGLHERTPGFSSRWLGECDLRAVEPRLTSVATSGLLTQGALSVNGEAFTQRLAQAAEQLGATVMCEAAVAVGVTGDRVTQVRTRQGLIDCDAVVFATGPWVADLKSWLGVTVLVRPSSGALLILRPAGPRLGCDLTCEPVTFHGRSDGLVCIGAMEHRREVLSAQETWDRLQSLGSTLVPELAQWEVVDRVAADRPMTEANIPIAARAPGWSNAFVANGGGGKGLLLSPLIAQRIGGLVTGAYVEALGEHLIEEGED